MKASFLSLFYTLTACFLPPSPFLFKPRLTQLVQIWGHWCKVIQLLSARERGEQQPGHFGGGRLSTHLPSCLLDTTHPDGPWGVQAKVSQTRLSCRHTSTCTILPACMPQAVQLRAPSLSLPCPHMR